MDTTSWLLLAAVLTVTAYGAGIVALLAGGRRSEARALAGFVPDCVGLVRRLLADPRVPRRRKALLLALLGYLALPFDLVPDFIPVAGQIDDLIVLVLVLRAVLRSGGPALFGEHWPGPPESGRLVLGLLFPGQPAMPETSRPTP